MKYLKYLKKILIKNKILFILILLIIIMIYVNLLNNKNKIKEYFRYQYRSKDFLNSIDIKENKSYYHKYQRKTEPIEIEKRGDGIYYFSKNTIINDINNKGKLKLVCSYKKVDNNKNITTKSGERTLLKFDDENACVDYDGTYHPAYILSR